MPRGVKKKVEKKVDETRVAGTFPVPGTDIELTLFQHRFCMEFLLPGVSLARAWTNAGGAAESEAEARDLAKQEAKKPKVHKALQEYARLAYHAIERKPEDIIRDLVRRGNKAEADGRYGDALRSTELEMKYHGLLVERVEVDDVTDRAERMKEARERVKNGGVLKG